MPKRILDVAFRALAAILFASLLVAAWHDVSKAWDVWFYHLPFAGRIVGLVDPATYTFGAANRARFEGFPLLAEALQGLLWRLSGRIECANLLSFAALPALAWFLRRAHGVPPHLTLLALVAVPLVQIHATASYVDLPANACATLLLLCVYRALVSRDPPSVRLLAAAAGLAAATANMKFQLVPIVVAASTVLVVRALRPSPDRNRRLLLIAVALPFVFATPLKNLALHGNPVWPVELQLLGRSLPHIEGAYASSPVWLEHAPRPVRFVCSVLEIGLRPIASHHRWSIDQWTPPREDGYRMGGLFGAYVAANVAALAIAALRRRTRETRVAAAMVLGLTIVTSSLPQSHELRYYLVWMLFLLCVNLALWAREAPLSTALVASTALAVVAWSTEATYLYPSGDRFETLMEARVGRSLDAIVPGERVCIAREPWTFLHAPLFHPEKRYAVQEAEGPSDCAGARPLD